MVASINAVLAMHRYISITLVICSLLTAGISFAENLLQNPGFEEEGGWVAHESAQLRNLWRSHGEGECNASLVGLWSDSGMNGMIEQRDIPVEPGNQYFFKVWLWADLGWSPSEQYISVTFYGADGQVVEDKRFPIIGLHPLWTPVMDMVTAPEGASFASFGVCAISVSSYGALSIDDAYFSNEPPPAITF